MRRVFCSLLFVSAALVNAADYPSIPLDKLLSQREQDELHIATMTAAQRETLRRAIIDVYLAGMEKGRQEAMKVAGSVSATSGVIESKIDGDFDGWEGETIVKLTNGQVWQQDQYHYEYHYAFMPDVLIYRSGAGYKMKVEGTDEAVGVVRLK
jgi:hypothetical protein